MEDSDTFNRRHFLQCTSRLDIVRMLSTDLKIDGNNLSTIKVFICRFGGSRLSLVIQFSAQDLTPAARRSAQVDSSNDSCSTSARHEIAGQGDRTIQKFKFFVQLQQFERRTRPEAHLLGFSIVNVLVASVMNE